MKVDVTPKFLNSVKTASLALFLEKSIDPRHDDVFVTRCYVLSVLAELKRLGIDIEVNDTLNPID